MTYYKFETFTTIYYFPTLARREPFLYGLYSAYGGLVSKLYWYLFRHSVVVRTLTRVKDTELNFSYDLICREIGANSVMSFNMGSPGVEQKISILGYDVAENQSFFAKFSQKDAAMKLTRNEIMVYEALKGSDLTPCLIDYAITSGYVFLKTECIKGERVSSRLVNQHILDLSLKLSKYHLTDKVVNENGLIISLSHGDFCPWNILETNNGVFRLIDWEMAKDRVLGYDLFTYICQVSALFNPQDALLSAIDKNKGWVDMYFRSYDICDYIPYLYEFAQEKYTYETSKGNVSMANKYRELLDVNK